MTNKNISKIELSKEDLKQIKTIASRVKNQDPEGKKWGTRPPLWFLLQDVEQREANLNGGTHLAYYDSDEAEQYVGLDANEIYKEITEGLGEDEIEEGLLSLIEDEAYPIEYEYVTKRIFHTYEAAKDHLECNHYHYSHKARIYCDHAWRDPEAELIHKLLVYLADNDFINLN